MGKKTEEAKAMNWLGANYNESNLDTLIDFTIAMVEEGDENLEGDVMLHAHTLALQMGFSLAETDKIISTVVQNLSQALSISSSPSPSA